MPVDLSDFDTKRAEAGERMVVNYPGSSPPVPLAHDGEEPVALILRGIDSGPYRSVRRELVKRRQEASARNKGNLPLEIMETESLDTVLACLVGWENIVLDGVPVEFSPDQRPPRPRAPSVAHRASGGVSARPPKFYREIAERLCDVVRERDHHAARRAAGSASTCSSGSMRLSACIPRACRDQPAAADRGRGLVPADADRADAVGGRHDLPHGRRFPRAHATRSRRAQGHGEGRCQ